MSNTAEVLERHIANAVREVVAELGPPIKAGGGAAQMLGTLVNSLAGQPRQRWIVYARALLSLGCPAEAARLLNAAATLWPDDTEVMYWQGNSLRIAKDARGAEALFRRVLAWDPKHEGAATSLAFLLRDQGRLLAAGEVVMSFRKARGGGLVETLKCGSFLTECRQQPLAAQVYADELESGTRDVRLFVDAASAQLGLGHFDLARSYLDQALAEMRDPRQIGEYALLFANSQKYQSDQHPDFARFRACIEDSSVQEESREAAAFALGKAYDDIGNYALATEAFRIGNALHKARRPWTSNEWDDFVDAELLRRYPPVPHALDSGGQPVFVVGMPRTGTTLVEELLGRSSEVRPRGELDWIRFTAEQLGPTGALTDPAELSRCSRMYLTHARRDDSPARWYVDKNPMNFLHLKLIAAMLPGARVIHCVRDRRDAALSIWSQLFARDEHRYAYDFRDIASFAAGHDRLMSAWHQAPLLPTLTVRYEELVANQDSVIEGMRAFLKLIRPVAAGAVSAERGIGTASVWQARQPVYTTSAGRWQRYRPFVPELDSMPAGIDPVR